MLPHSTPKDCTHDGYGLLCVSIPNVYTLHVFLQCLPVEIKFRLKFALALASSPYWPSTFLQFVTMGVSEQCLSCTHPRGSAGLVYVMPCRFCTSDNSQWTGGNYFTKCRANRMEPKLFYYPLSIDRKQCQCPTNFSLPALQILHKRKRGLS